MIYNDITFSKLPLKEQEQIKLSYPFMYEHMLNERPRTITRQEVTLDDIQKIYDIMFVTAFISNEHYVSLTAYMGDVRFECFTTIWELEKRGMEVK